MANRTGLLTMIQQGHLCDKSGKHAKSINQIQRCMEDLEQCHRVLSLWLWLSHRLGERGQFPGQRDATSELRLVQVDGLLLLSPTPCSELYHVRYTFMLG